MTTDLTALVMLERAFVDGDASPLLMVGGDGCRRGLPQQCYEFGVEFRFNSPKVQQDNVFAHAANHRWIQPSQRLQQRMRRQGWVAKRYGRALQPSRRRGSTTDEAEDRNRFCEKIAGSHLAGYPFASPENF